MSKYKKSGFINMFRNALKGMRLALKSERNARIHVAAAVFVILLGIFLRFTPIEFAILAVAIFLVIMAEMFNSAIEFSLDAVFHNKYSKMVGMVKDIAAGAVMVATFCS